MDSNRWIGRLQDFVENYNSSYHSTIKNIPERLELFDEVELIRASIEHNLKINNWRKLLVNLRKTNAGNFLFFPAKKRPDWALFSSNIKFIQRCTDP